jgi:hypothetical protein
MVIFPAEGLIAPPESPVSVFKAPVFVPNNVQTEDKPVEDDVKDVNVYSAFPVWFIHLLPIVKNPFPVSVVAGALTSI